MAAKAARYSSRYPGSTVYEAFYAYKNWLHGNQLLGKEIFLNVVLFMPFGFVMHLLASERKSVLKL